MKILLCTPTFNTVTHGPAKFAQLVFRINEAYPEHELRILTENPTSEDNIKIIGIKIYCPRPFHAIKNFVRAVQYYRKGLEIYEEFPFDVIVYNNAILGLWTALKNKKAFAIVGMLNDYENISIGKRPRKNEPVRKWLIRSVFKWAERLSLKYLDGTLVCSDYLKNRVIAAYKISPTKIFRLYSSIDVHALVFRSRALIDYKHQIHILFVKVDYKVGGLSILLSALAKLQHYRFKLTVIGPKEKVVAQTMPSLAWPKNVELAIIGPQTQEKVYHLLETADIFSVPSIREGLGVANMEALAIGIPVITTTAGGIPEVTGDGAYGWLAKPESVEDLADQISQCLQNPELSHMKSIRGRKWVEDSFDFYRMLREFLQILDLVIQRKRNHQ